jgi:DHA2 family multidrug resistance protein
MSEWQDAAWRPRGSVWLVAGAATLAPFMEILDTTIVNVSLPNIAGALSASNDDATWTLTSYLVANGIIVPVAGWFGRLIGRKRYFLICIAAFTVCSSCAAWRPTSSSWSCSGCCRGCSAADCSRRSSR